ncbi:MAG: alanine--glyoxylate aminotransferase family protein [Desulfovibrio sp.]|jgi:alanine-glyoxylate transaminase/serine-glyoxylate transaminase/serine-pyruvate transaminase|nr:alanine--glyoxylate aminotransferase family protein [Desulfovibrio sp.]
MPNLLDGIKPTLLMGPGPSCVYDEVYAALAKPTIGHLDPYFIKIMDAVKDDLKAVLGTSNRLTMPMSGTGSSGMETCFVNLVEPGDKVLILTNGVFGKRMEDVAGRLGAEVDSIQFEWGTPVLPQEVEKKLKGQKYSIVAVVHAETSTGVRNPVQEVGDLVKAAGALYLVDCVTSLGGIPVRMDEWGADALYSGTQKCLSCPPGLAPLSFSDRAVEKLKARKSKVPNWYLDLTMIMNYWEGNTRAYHHTAPINMIYGLYAALRHLLEEGPDNAHARHRAAHEQLVSGLEKLGASMYVDKSCRLPMLNAVTIPQGLDDAGIRGRLLKEFDIEIGNGLGPLAGKIWRIGLMGHTARPENVDRLLKALTACMKQ